MKKVLFIITLFLISVLAYGFTDIDSTPEKIGGGISFFDADSIETASSQASPIYYPSTTGMSLVNELSSGAKIISTFQTVEATVTTNGTTDNLVSWLEAYRNGGWQRVTALDTITSVSISSHTYTGTATAIRVGVAAQDTNIVYVGASAK